MELNAIEDHKYSDPQTLVTEFHAKMGLPVASEPTVGTPRQRELRVRLMLEEVLEFAKAAGVNVTAWDGAEAVGVYSTADLRFEASERGDLVQMTHELADVQYVVSGTAVELGLPVHEAIPLIHEANMRKEPVLDSGGKVRKPEGWVPADVSGLLKK
jgi:predicted HAD superfamily Cof-like phosphohydrolase